MARKLRLQYPEAVYHLMSGRDRPEWTMPRKWICDRLEMGSWKSVHRRLYENRKTNVDMLMGDPFMGSN
jgi:hypothetical protein